MNIKKYMMLIIIILTLIIIFVQFQYSTSEFDENRTILTIYGVSSSSVEELVDDIKTNSHYKGYNEDTVIWLSSLKGKKIFVGNNILVVMDENNAKKLPIEFATDVSIEDIFSCVIVEKRSLGNNLSDVLYVKDVEFIRQNITYYEV